MDTMPIHALLLQSIPESIAFISLGLALAGVWPPFRRVVAVSVFYAILTYIIRRLPFYFGLHTLIMLTFLVLILKYGLRISYIRALLTMLLGSVFLGLIESMSLPIMEDLTRIKISHAVQDPLLRVLFPLPEEILLGILAYLCWQKRFSLIRPEKEEKYRM